MPSVIVLYEEIARLIGLILERYNEQFKVQQSALKAEDVEYGFIATREGFKNAIRLTTLDSGDALRLKIYIEYISSEKPYITPFRLEVVQGESGDDGKVYVAMAKLPREIFPAASKYIHVEAGVFRFTSATFDTAIVTVERVGGTAGSVTLNVMAGSGDGYQAVATITFDDGEGGTKNADTQLTSEQDVDLELDSNVGTLGSPTTATVLFGYEPPTNPLVSWVETPQDFAVENVGEFIYVIAHRDNTDGALAVEVELIVNGNLIGMTTLNFDDVEPYASFPIEVPEFPTTYELTIQPGNDYGIGDIQTVNGTVTQVVAGEPGVMSFASPTGSCGSVTLNRTGGSDGYAEVMIGFIDSEASFGPVSWNHGDSSPKTVNICGVSLYEAYELYLFSASGATIDEDNDTMTLLANGAIEFTAASSPCNQAKVVRYAPAGGPASVQIWQNLEEMFGTITWNDGESGEKSFNACPYHELSGDATFNLQEINGAPPGDQLVMTITAEEALPTSVWVHRFDYLTTGSVISPTNIATSVYNENLAVYSDVAHTGSLLVDDYLYLEVGLTLPELDFNYSLSPAIEAHSELTYGAGYAVSTSQISIGYDFALEEWTLASAAFNNFSVTLPNKPSRVGLLFQASTKKTWINIDGVYYDSTGSITGAPSANNYSVQAADVEYSNSPELIFALSSGGLAAQTTGQPVVLELCTRADNIVNLPAGATPWDDAVEGPAAVGWGEPTVDGWFGAGTFDGIWPEDGFFGPVPTDPTFLRTIRKFGMSSNEAYAGLIDAGTGNWLNKTSGKWTAAFKIKIVQPSLGTFGRVVVGFGDDQLDQNNFFNYPSIQAGVYFGRGGAGHEVDGEISKFARDGNLSPENNPAPTDESAYIQLFMDIDTGECRVHYTYGNALQPPGPISALPLITGARGTGPMGIRAYMIPWDTADITIVPYVTADAIASQSWTAPASEYQPFADTSDWFEVTYDPATKGSNIVLSNGNLTASSTLAPTQFVYGTHQVAGDFAIYLEQQWSSIGNSQSFGFLDPSGHGGFVIQYAPFGNPTTTQYSNSGGVPNTVGPALGDTFNVTLGIAIKVVGTVGKVWIRHDDGSWVGGGDPQTDTSPTFSFVTNANPKGFYTQMDGSFGSGTSVTVATLGFEYQAPVGFSPISVFT